MMMTGLCRNDFYPSDTAWNDTYADARIRRYLNYYGTGSKLVFIQMLMDIPLHVFQSYITVKLSVLLFKRLRRRRHHGLVLTREQKELLFSSLPHSVESRYVRNLLGMNDSKKSKNWFRKIFRRVYAWRDDFRFSARIVSVFGAIFLLLYFVTIQVKILCSKRGDENSIQSSTLGACAIADKPISTSRKAATSG